MKKKHKSNPLYATGRRRVHRNGPAATSLVVECVKNGSLDVRCETGEVFTEFRRRVRRKVHIDSDGYAGFTLNVESKTAGRRFVELRKGGKQDKRRRRSQYVLVHRLVLAKLQAVERHGDNWQARFRELPLCLDVDHKDTNRANNRADNLRVRTIEGNRGKAEYSETEAKAVAEFLEEL